jgi:peptidoglycan/LPS O-acetylase OafA/YrhL
MSVTTHGTHLHRSLGLDLLRLIAVLLVIGRHAYLPETAPLVLKVWRRAGWMGVDLFFVLRGFLVSSLLFQEYERTGRIALGRFLVRRGFKIYPAFWFFIAATIVGMMAVGKPVKTINLAAELCFIQNYVPGLWNHTWSLAVEEHFYILIGGLMLWISGRKTEMKTSALVPVVCVGVMVGCGLTRIATWHFMPFTMRGYMFPSHLRFDSLMAGVLLAYLVLFFGGC